MDDKLQLENDNSSMDSISKSGLERDENGDVKNSDIYEIEQQATTNNNGSNYNEKLSDTCEPDNRVTTIKTEHDSEESVLSDLIDETDIMNDEDLFLQREMLLDGRSELPIPTPETVTDDGTIECSTGRGAQEVVTVKFRTDTNEAVTSAFMLHSHISQVKERLASILKLHVDDIGLSCDGNNCDDLMMLSSLGAEPMGTIELGIHLIDPSKIMVLSELSNYIPVVDVITVRVPRETGIGFKDVVVEIEYQCSPKPWLGGFRHRITKVEYHHAANQTLPRRRPLGSLPQFSKAIQTPRFPLKNIAVDTSHSRGTQVLETDYCIPNITDKVVATNSDRFLQKPTTCTNLSQVTSVVTKAQKNFRQNVIKQKEQREKEQIMWGEDFSPDNKRTCNAVFPLKRSDFYLLYLLIGKWWRKEMSRISRTKNDESRAAALLALLEREVSLLSAIEQQRIQAKKVNWLRKNIRFLEMSARPIIFRNDKGVATWIDTIGTQQAREYQEIITSFMNTSVTKQERLNVVNTVKNMIKGYGHHDFINEIVNLLERETQLLMLGMKNNQLTSLRERVMQLLIDFFHRFINDSNKSFNFPQRVGEAQKKSLHCCAHCNKLKPATDYNVHVKMTSFNTCRSCEWMKNIGNDRIDLSPYSRLLSQVRQLEMQNCSYSSTCYVLQVVGMYYLVHHIWCCKSILSDVNDMNELRMVRFRKDEDWSPWNCILLTAEESNAHLSIPDVHKFYGQSFLEQIHWKHQRAKNHFFPLLLNDKSIRDNNVWLNMKDSLKL